MTRNQKRNLITMITLIGAFLALIITYWCIIRFNPFVWIEEHASVFILWAALIACASLIVLGFWLTHRRKL